VSASEGKGVGLGEGEGEGSLWHLACAKAKQVRD
jgi:hypothetical protein